MKEILRELLGWLALFACWAFIWATVMMYQS
jgi:hypothetical protein